MAGVKAARAKEVTQTYNNLRELRDDQWRYGELDLKVPFDLINKVLNILKYINENGTGSKRHK